MDLEHRSSKPEVASSSLAEAISIADLGLRIWDLFNPKSQISNPKSLRGRLTERTLDFESGEKGLNPFPEANFLLSRRSADDYTGRFWKPVFAGLNPAA